MQTLQQAFREQAHKTPYLLALKDSSHNTMTYGRLDKVSDQLAHYLIDHYQLERGAPVAIYLDRCLDYVALALGVLKAGGAFIPMDTTYPASLVEQVIDEAGPTVILTNHYYRQFLPAEAVYWSIDQDWPQTVAHKPARPYDRLCYHPEDTACLVYSSGTTGRPKGVELPQRAIMSSYEWRYTIEDYHPNEKVACHIFFIWEVFRPLLRGATSYIIDDELLHDIPRFLETLAIERIDEILLTPSFLETIFHCTDPHTLQNKFTPNRCWLNGEPVSTGFREKLLEKLPHVNFYNLYSISECHDVAAVNLSSQKFKIDPESRYCSVGSVMPQASYYIVDDLGKPVPSGQSGELHIAGPGVAKGYLNRPDLTQNKFKSGHKNRSGKMLYKTGDLARIDRYGQLEILGRCDFMVKIRGYSIQLTAVDAAIKSLPEVRQCVTNKVVTDNDERLVAFIQPTDAGHQKLQWLINPDSGQSPELAKKLKHSLPHYMVPTTYVLVDELPIDPVLGTVNYQQLPQPPRPASDHELDQQASIKTLWCHYLGLDPDQVDGDTDFFELGGNSLTAIQLIHAVEQHHQIGVTVQELFQNNTLNTFETMTANHSASARESTDDTIDWHNEATIELDTGSANDISTVNGPAGSILLTGATGLLGRFVLNELLTHTNAVIYCLVRAQTPEQGFDRIKHTLSKCGLWHDRHAKRIIAVAGDLTQNQLGLANADYESLSQHTESIIHCGASVNLIYPYRALKPTIVSGTEAIVKLAATNTLKPLHFVSSNGIYPNLTRHFYEQQSIDEHIGHLKNGYSQAKWVAEKMVWQAHAQGVPVTVYRPGNLGPHSESAIFNQQDFNYLMLQASMQTGYLPESFTLEMTPVDWIARAITAIANHEYCQGKAYNMHQPNAITGSQLAKSIRQLTGDNIQACDYPQWRALLPSRSQIGHLLDIHQDELLNPQPTIDQKQFKDMVRELRLSHDLTSAALEQFINLCRSQTQEVTTHD